MLSTFPPTETLVKGENQWRLKPLPKTALKLFQLCCLCHFPVSFLSCSIPVSSCQMACTWTPNIIKVNIANSRASKTRQTNNIIVHGVGVLVDVPLNGSNVEPQSLFRNKIMLYINTNFIYNLNIQLKALLLESIVLIVKEIIKY